MIFLFELLIGSIEGILLIFGSIFTYILGKEVYLGINKFLYANTTPCLEVISFVAAFVAPLAFFYGVHHKKLFSQRSNSYNIIILVLSFLFGSIVTFFPQNTFAQYSSLLYCPEQTELTSLIAQSFSTGLITVLLTYPSLDFGVIYANFVAQAIRAKDRGKSK